jgi:crotonobetainyl-CoA hydratase
MEQSVETERHGGALVIVLNRPKVNAISREFSRAIYAAARMLQDDPALRVGIITAKGDRVFSAGWDFNEAASPSSEDDDHGPGGFGGITAFWDLNKPLIAAVNGAAIGGGFEIALAADIILMSEHAYFELPEMQRGFLPDAGGLQRLPRRIPHNVAVEMMLSGRRMDAAEARHWGLAHKVVPPTELMKEALALGTQIAMGAPLATQALKEVVRHIEQLTIEEAMTVVRPAGPELPTYQRMWASPDAIEGPRAFLERRPPVWRG